MLESDGVATAGSVGYDGEELSGVMGEWAAESGKLSYHLGPMLPLEPGSGEFTQNTINAEIAAAPPGVGSQVQNFLSDVLKRRGVHSVIYICFGTTFWFVFLQVFARFMNKCTLTGQQMPIIFGYCWKPFRKETYLL